MRGYLLLQDVKIITALKIQIMVLHFCEGDDQFAIFCCDSLCDRRISMQLRTWPEIYLTCGLYHSRSPVAQYCKSTASQYGSSPGQNVRPGLLNSSLNTRL